MASLIALRILLIVVVIVTGSAFSSTRDDEIYRLLKKLNKPSLKSIKVYVIYGFIPELHLTTIFSFFACS